MTYNYKTKGTCAQLITITVNDNDGTIENVEFLGGCNGNLKGISRLIQGMKPKDVADRLEGVKCGYKNTSCPDQLAKALRQLEK